MSGPGAPMAGISRCEVDALVRRAPPHLQPILRAVRDHGIGLVSLFPGGEAADIAPMLAARPSVVIIGDDTGCAVGPAGFNQPALELVFTAAQMAFLQPGAPDRKAYAAAAWIAAGMRGHAVIIETTPECELDWKLLLARYGEGAAA